MHPARQGAQKVAGLLLQLVPPGRVVRPHHLKALLEREMIRFEEPALLALGRAAQGSMRDALSLLGLVQIVGRHLEVEPFEASEGEEKE